MQDAALRLPQVTRLTRILYAGVIESVSNHTVMTRERDSIIMHG